MQKSRAQIINFENNQNINKSIVFVSLLIHYFAACVCSKLWYVMGKYMQYHYIFLLIKLQQQSFIFPYMLSGTLLL